MLTVEGLKKTYGSRTVVDGVSMTVAAGRIVGLLGPNGAGKTTTVSMICGLTPADAGEVALNGQRIGGDASPVKCRLGLVPQDLALHEELSARHNLALFGSLYGVNGAALKSRSEEVLALVGLADRADDRPATFSGGMKRRLNIACSLMHDPDVLILDEPTVGVDPQSRNAIFANLETLRDRGKGLIYTTHYMEEVERLADEIVILDHGKVVAEGTLDAVKRRVPQVASLSLLPAAPFDAAFLADLPGVQGTEWRDGRMVVSLASLDAAGSVLNRIAAAGHTVLDIQSGRATLEDVFLALTGRQLRD
ncbi:MAG: ABC transporter ATP-binding protein [Burkholderiales bacterium]|nr:ABC transporter ATP-binding protein [Burkholderiales bacterium]